MFVQQQQAAPIIEQTTIKENLPTGLSAFGGLNQASTTTQGLQSNIIAEEAFSSNIPITQSFNTQQLPVSSVQQISSSMSGTQDVGEFIRAKVQQDQAVIAQDMANLKRQDEMKKGVNFQPQI